MRGNPALTHWSALISLVTVLHVLTLTLSAIPEYPVCTNRLYNFYGYTYKLDPQTGIKTWTHCSFPNPKHDHALCNAKQDGEYHYLCDPDRILSSDQASHVDSALQSVKKGTSSACKDVRGDSEGFVVAIFVVGSIRMHDATSEKTCTNECGEIHPTLNITQRPPSSHEISAAIENFADGLRQHLSMGACDNEVIIVYSAYYRKIYTSVGSYAKFLLTSSKIALLNDKFLNSLDSQSLYLSLLALAKGYYVTLLALPPAYIMLAANLVALLLMAILCPLSFYLIPTPFNVWGDSRTSYVVKSILYYTCGIWLINALLIGAFYVHERLSIWTLTTLGCMVLIGLLLVLLSALSLI